MVEHKPGSLECRGYRVLLNCPVCLRQALTVDDARSLANFLNRGLLEEAEVFLDMRGLRLFILEPRKPEEWQLLSHRIAAGALCGTHGQINVERIEQAVVLGSVYGQVEGETL